MYVCMYACRYVCMYACTHECMYVCMHVYMYLCACGGLVHVVCMSCWTILKSEEIDVVCIMASMNSAGPGSTEECIFELMLIHLLWFYDEEVAKFSMIYCMRMNLYPNQDQIWRQLEILDLIKAAKYICTNIKYSEIKGDCGGSVHVSYRSWL